MILIDTDGVGIDTPDKWIQEDMSWGPAQDKLAFFSER